MLILGIDTCCAAATAAVMDENKLIAQSVINCGRTHSQKLMPQLASMLELAEIEITEIDLFAAAVGPGSFTGVRIGVAAVKAMAQACGKPCAAVSSLHALAYNNSLFSGLVCPILDARRGQVYNALFLHGKRLCEDRALALSALLEELKIRTEPVLFCGDGTLVFREEITAALGARAVFAPRMQNLNLAAAVAELALLGEGEQTAASGLVPQYIRLSQAERERKEREERNREGIQ